MKRHAPIAQLLSNDAESILKVASRDWAIAADCTPRTLGKGGRRRAI